jgi:hypothetical protein
MTTKNSPRHPQKSPGGLFESHWFIGKIQELMKVGKLGLETEDLGLSFGVATLGAAG